MPASCHCLSHATCLSSPCSTHFTGQRSATKSHLSNQVACAGLMDVTNRQFIDPKPSVFPRLAVAGK